MYRITTWIFFALLLSACSTAGQPFRPISSDEVKSITPVGYVVANQGAYPKTEMVIPLTINGKSGYTAIFFVSPDGYDESKPPKTAITFFDSKKGEYKLAYDFFDINGVELSSDYQLSDIDGDGTQEIETTATVVCGSSCDYGLNVITIKNEKIVNLAENIPTSNYGFEFQPDKNSYQKIDYIWEEGEGHFGCHRWAQETIGWNGSTLLSQSRKVTNEKFALDAGDANGACPVISKQSLTAAFE